MKNSIAKTMKIYLIAALLLVVTLSASALMFNGSANIAPKQYQNEAVSAVSPRAADKNITPEQAAAIKLTLQPTGLTIQVCNPGTVPTYCGKTRQDFSYIAADSGKLKPIPNSYGISIDGAEEYIAFTADGGKNVGFKNPPKKDYNLGNSSWSMVLWSAGNSATDFSTIFVENGTNKVYWHIQHEAIDRKFYISSTGFDEGGGGGIVLPTTATAPTGKTFTYDAKSHTGVDTGTGYTLSGTTSATDAGTYKAIATLKSGYTWSDGATGTKEISWTINKAPQDSPLSFKSYETNFSSTEPYILNAQGGGPGELYYTITNSESQRYATVTTDGWLTMIKAGNITINVTRKETNNYLASNPVNGIGFTIKKGSQPTALNITSAATHTFGTPYTLSATGGDSGGALSYSITSGGTGAGNISGNTLTITRIGTIKIIATRAGNDNYNPVSSATFTLTVSAATPTIAVTSSAVDYGNKLNLGVTGNAGNGTVTYSWSNSSAGSYASYTNQIFNNGTYYVKASVAASGNYTAANSGAVAVTVNVKKIVLQANQITKFSKEYGATSPTALTQNIPAGSNNETLNVTYAGDFGANVGTTGITGVTLSSVTGGNGNTANYNVTLATNAGVGKLEVTKAQSAMSFNSSSINKKLGDANFTNAVNNTKGDGAVTYTSSVPSVATVDNAGNVTLLSVGTTVITATMADTTNFKGVSATYTINFSAYSLNFKQANGSETAATKSEGKYGESFTLPIAAKSGWIFEGWSETENSHTGATGAITRPQKDVTYYPIFSKKLTLSYANGTNSGTLETTIYNNETQGESTLDLPALTSTTGFVHIGWADNNLTGDAAVVDSNLAAHKVTITLEMNGKTYYARSNLTVTITYDTTTNGGTGEVASSTGIIQQVTGQATYVYPTITLSTTSAVKSGWIFVGWNSDSAAKESIPFISGQDTAKITKVYAIYKKDIAVSLYNESSTVVAKTLTATIWNTETNHTFTLENFTTAGWTHIGYRTDKLADVQTLAPTAAVTVGENTAYYAVYSRVLTVNYNVGGGAAIAATVATQYKNADIYSSGVVTLATAATKENFIFDNWAIGSTNYDAGATYTFDGANSVTSIEMVAKYTAAEAKIGNTMYRTIQDAIGAASIELPVIILKDTTLTSAITISKNIILSSLNGSNFTLTNSGNVLNITAGDVTLNNVNLSGNINLTAGAKIITTAETATNAYNVTLIGEWKVKDTIVNGSKGEFTITCDKNDKWAYNQANDIIVGGMLIKDISFNSDNIVTVKGDFIGNKDNFTVNVATQNAAITINGETFTAVTPKSVNAGKQTVTLSYTIGLNKELISKMIITVPEIDGGGNKTGKVEYDKEATDKIYYRKTSETAEKIWVIFDESSGTSGKKELPNDAYIDNEFFAHFKLVEYVENVQTGEYEYKVYVGKRSDVIDPSIEPGNLPEIDKIVIKDTYFIIPTRIGYEYLIIDKTSQGYVSWTNDANVTINDWFEGTDADITVNGLETAPHAYTVLVRKKGNDVDMPGEVIVPSVDITTITIENLVTKAKEEIDTEKGKIIDIIDKLTKLPSEEKELEKKKVEDIATKAKEDIDKVTDPDKPKKIDEIIKEAKKDITDQKDKAKAKDDIDTEKGKIIDIINKLTKLTPEEKELEKKKVEDIAKKAKEDIDKITDPDPTIKIGEIVEKAKKDITDQKDKAKAKDDIDIEKGKTIDVINELTNLTTEEKDLAKGKVEDIVTKAKDAIDKVTDPDTTIKIGELVEKAKKEITDEQNLAKTKDLENKKKATIDELDKFAEKYLLPDGEHGGDYETGEIKKIIDEIKKAINDATNLADVDAAINVGKDTLKGVKPKQPTASIDYFDKDIIGLEPNVDYTITEGDKTYKFTADPDGKIPMGGKDKNDKDYDFNGKTISIVKDKTSEQGESKPQKIVALTYYTFTINYNGNGQNNLVLDVLSGQPAAIQANPTREGYTFTGWYSDAGCANEFSFKYDTITANTMVYAGWASKDDIVVEDKITVTYISNGETFKTLDVSKNSYITELTELPTKEGMLFAGWYSDAKLTHKWSYKDKITSNITLYAKFTSNKVTITFIDGTKAELNYGEKLPLPALPEKEGMTFAGWYTDSALTSALIFEGELSKFGMTKDTTLYAKWVENTFEVTGKVIDEKGDPIKDAIVTIGTQPDEKTFTTDKDGNYTITGVPNGNYRIDVSYNKGGKTTYVTEVINVDGANVVVTDIILKGAGLNSSIEIEDEAPDVAVGGLNDIFIGDEHVSSAEKEEAKKANSSVEIKFVVSKSNEDKTLEKAATDSQKIIGSYLDFSLFKIVTVNGAKTESYISSVTALLRVIIPLSSDLYGKSNYVVLRMHNGVTEEIKMGQANANANGEYITMGEDGKYLIVYTKNFSSYAIAFDEPIVTNNKCFLHWLLLALIIIFLVLIAIFTFIFGKKSLANIIVWVNYVVALEIMTFFVWSCTADIILWIIGVVLAIVTLLLYLSLDRIVDKTFRFNYKIVKIAGQKFIDGYLHNVSADFNYANAWSKTSFNDIPRKVNNKKIGLYTDYSQDMSKYTYITGAEVKWTTATSRTIKAGSFALVTVPNITLLDSAWEYINTKADIKRKYDTDFEVFNDNGTVDIYVSIAEAAPQATAPVAHVDPTPAQEVPSATITEEPKVEKVAEEVTNTTEETANTAAVNEVCEQAQPEVAEENEQAQPEVSEENADEEVEQISELDSAAKNAENERKLNEFMLAKRKGEVVIAPILFKLSREDILDYMDNIAQKFAANETLDTRAFEKGFDESAMDTYPVQPNVKLRASARGVDSLRCGEWCFGMVYTRRDNIKLVLRCDDDTAKKLMSAHTGVKRSLFPKGENWYDVVIDSSYLSKKEVFAILYHCYIYVLTKYYEIIDGEFVTDETNAKIADEQVANEVLENENTVDADFENAIKERKKAEKEYFANKSICDISKAKIVEHIKNAKNNQSTILDKKPTSPASAKIDGATYAIIYQGKTITRLILRLDDNFAETISSIHPLIRRAKFPKGKNWYLVEIDSSFTNNRQVYSLITKAKNYIIQSNKQLES